MFQVFVACNDKTIVIDCEPSTTVADLKTLSMQLNLVSFGYSSLLVCEREGIPVALQSLKHGRQSLLNENETLLQASLQKGSLSSIVISIQQPMISAQVRFL